jgi:hypothetical protein
MVWNAQEQVSTLSRDEAKSEILDMARDQGIEGAFKVFYQGELISTPDALPERVTMDAVRVSAVLDQAEG